MTPSWLWIIFHNYKIQILKKKYNKYNSLNILLRRDDTTYDENGRFQNLQESKDNEKSPLEQAKSCVDSLSSEERQELMDYCNQKENDQEETEESVDNKEEETQEQEQD